MSSLFTAPIDLIKPSESSTTCTRKCEYVVGYKKTSFQIDVKGDHLLFKPLFGSATMMYNGATYAIYDMRLYRGSLHAWNGDTADCELQITHKTLNGGETLVICIPVDSKGSGGGVADLMDPVTNVEQTVEYDPSRLVPNARYYSYNGTGQFNKSFTGITYVVFDKADALYISETKYDQLKNGVGLTKTKFGDSNGSDPRMSSTAGDASSLLYSSGPPNSGQGMMDDIYIECKPTGEEGEEQVDKKNTGVYNFNLSTALQNDIAQWLMKVVVGIFVFVCVLRIFDSFSKKVLLSKPPANQ